MIFEALKDLGIPYCVVKYKESLLGKVVRYRYEILIDFDMRMLRIPELKRIMGFPSDYVLVGTQADQKKFIGNAVEVNMARVLCEALCSRLIEEDILPKRVAA